MKRDFSYLKEMIAHALGLVGLLWILFHLILIRLWGEVVITERLRWVLYGEILLIGIIIVLFVERFISHTRSFWLSDLALGKEVLKIAIDNEKNGYTFYDTMAKSAIKREVRDVFTDLAAAERVHEETFINISRQLGEDGADPGYLADDYHRLYIQDLRKSSLFTGENARVAMDREILSEVGAIDMGIGLEKDSILLYMEMRGRIPRRVVKAVELVIKEEQKHLNRLTEMRSQLVNG